MVKKTKKILILTKLIKSNIDKTKKKFNCDKTKKNPKLWKNSRTQTVIKLKKKNWDKT